MIQKILVTGSTGQLGQEIRRSAANYTDTEFIWCDRTVVDLTDQESIYQIHDFHPDLVINCAAYTAVDKAEEEHNLAYLINSTALEHLGTVCHKLDIPIIHFSSDYVYHNDLRRPLNENDPTTPQGIYAKSKLEGEHALIKTHSYPLIFRVSWLYSTFGHNFPKTMLRLGKERTELSVVNDQIGAPTNAADLAAAVLSIAHTERPQDWKVRSGVYNYANLGVTHWAGIAAFIMEEVGLTCNINEIPTKDYPTPAPRPPYSVLDLGKFSRIFNLPLTEWKTSMQRCLQRLLNEKAG